MAFIVSLFKYIILGLCFVMLVAIVFGLMWAVDSGVFQNAETAASTIALLAAGTMFFVLYIGGIAILMSLHDRHRELAEGVHLIADELKRISNESAER